MSDSGGDNKDIWNDNYVPNTFQPNNISYVNNQEQYMTQNGNQQGAPSPTGNYSMLPVGNGNFLKVYHNNDDNLKYNNYELFASNSFAPHQMINTQQQNQENFMFNSSASTSQIHENNVPQHTTPQPVTQQHLRSDNAATSVFLSQLVGNWVPNISGTYSPFGEATPSSDNSNKFPVIVNENHDEFISHQNDVIKPVEKPKEIIRPPSFIARKGQSDGQNKSEVKKPRIVAEVKPMRMSYSDVVSKHVAINSKDNISENSGFNNSGSDKPVKILSDKNKANNINFEKKSDEKEINKPKKNFSKIDNSNNVSYFPERKTNLIDEESKENSGQENDVNKTTNKKKTTKPKGKNKSDNSHSDKKRRSNNASQPEFEEDYDDDDDDMDDDIEESPSFFYNVAKTVISENNSEKLFSKPSHNKRTKGTTVTNRTTIKHEKNSYKRNQKCRRNRNYVFVVKMLEKWLEYSMKILTWFLSLVSDVVFLSFGIVWERVKIGYQYCCQGCSSIKSELKNNSGLPTTWIKNLYKKFDSKFGKNSKWAFWRNLFAKKKIVEPVTDFYKNGRLPQTGDEAMYSLLNCKGKDAYSILGVTTECPQEQIRKHYKKIAVLVHPDKNKQPGAEEAFKILQRAFELIGEPVSLPFFFLLFKTNNNYFFLNKGKS